MDLELKLKSIDIDIEGLSKIYNINGSCELERLQEMRENALKIRKLLSEIETPALTKAPIIDKITFKKLLLNIVNDDRFIIKKTENQIYLLSKQVNELLKCKNIDRKKFYEFFRGEMVITTKSNCIACRVGNKVYSSIVINTDELNRVVSIDHNI